MLIVSNANVSMWKFVFLWKSSIVNAKDRVLVSNRWLKHSDVITIEMGSHNFRINYGKLCYLLCRRCENSVKCFSICAIEVSLCSINGNIIFRFPFVSQIQFRFDQYQINHFCLWTISPSPNTHPEFAKTIPSLMKNWQAICTTVSVLSIIESPQRERGNGRIKIQRTTTNLNNTNKYDPDSVCFGTKLKLNERTHILRVRIFFSSHASRVNTRRDFDWRTREIKTYKYDGKARGWRRFSHNIAIFIPQPPVPDCTNMPALDSQSAIEIPICGYNE